MSWLFSRALVEEYSEANCLDGEPFAPLSGNHTQQAFLPNDKMTAFSRLSRFGMTFAHLTDDLGRDVLTWFQEGFHAKTSVLQGKELESQELEAECGPKWRASLAKFDPDSSSWKTAQLSLLGGLELSSVTWPRSGMTAAGECWELPTLEPTTKETGSGLLPTPLASNTKAHHMRSNGRSARSYLPTPVSSDTGIRKHPYAQGGTALSLAVKMWRTPGACVVEPKSTVVKLTGRKPSDPQVGLADQVGGSLNPPWVEWLMGWPLGWTDLKPLATDKYRSALQQPGDY